MSKPLSRSRKGPFLSPKAIVDFLVRPVDRYRYAADSRSNQSFGPLFVDERSVGGNVDAHLARRDFGYYFEQVFAKKDLSARKMDLLQPHRQQLIDDSDHFRFGQFVLGMRMPIVAHNATKIASFRKLNFG